MAKLYFRYGTVGSAKTLNLLAVAHNYRQQGKQVLLMKPSRDCRFGEDKIRSRAGLEQEVDLLLEDNTTIPLEKLEGINCLLVDEAQFLSSQVIDRLRDISTKENIPTICYGLRTDFKGSLFEGSKRLLELADSIEEIKTTCSFCDSKATMNLRHANGEAMFEGETFELGLEDKYLPSCYKCYDSKRP